MRQRYNAKIRFTIDKDHPDIKCVKNWTEKKKFTFEDVYIFTEDYSEEYILYHIKRDMCLVAGGGFNTAHIHNVKFDIKKL